jgi:DNA anti-recombination protein RmuC
MNLLLIGLTVFNCIMVMMMLTLANKFADEVRKYIDESHKMFGNHKRILENIISTMGKKYKERMKKRARVEWELNAAQEGTIENEIEAALKKEDDMEEQAAALKGAPTDGQPTAIEPDAIRHDIPERPDV